MPIDFAGYIRDFFSIFGKGPWGPERPKLYGVLAFLSAIGLMSRPYSDGHRVFYL